MHLNVFFIVRRPIVFRFSPHWKQHWTRYFPNKPDCVSDGDGIGKLSLRLSGYWNSFRFLGCSLKHFLMFCGCQVLRKGRTASSAELDEGLQKGAKAVFDRLDREAEGVCAFDLSPYDWFACIFYDDWLD